MSTLRVNNITDTSGGSSSLSVPGRAHAYASWGGSNGSISNSFNVSSVTYGGTGIWTVNFINPAPVSNVVGVVCADGNYNISTGVTGRTTTTCTVNTRTGAGALYNPGTVFGVFYA